MRSLILDPSGGISGDMFIAAFIDLDHENVSRLKNNFTNMPLMKNVKIVNKKIQKPFNGSSIAFTVKGLDTPQSIETIEKLISENATSLELENLALTIFHELVNAEQSIHGTHTSNITLHEIGSIDTVLDCLFASFFIQQYDCSWNLLGPLTLGTKSISFSHGTLNSPSPAALELLKGFPVNFDNSISENITPTGAAILKVLNPKISNGVNFLVRSGYGYGHKKFHNRANYLRIIESKINEFVNDDKVIEIEFEVDDQTSEDLSIAINNLQKIPGVIDVLVMSGYGKKNRIVFAIRILVNIENFHDISDACFLETSTIGLRYKIVERKILRREVLSSNETQSNRRVKESSLPNGKKRTKVESEALAEITNYEDRKEIKNLHERR
jgi:uncharacterized protein (DUF111 family)